MATNNLADIVKNFAKTSSGSLALFTLIDLVISLMSLVLAYGRSNSFLIFRMLRWLLFLTVLLSWNASEEFSSDKGSYHASRYPRYFFSKFFEELNRMLKHSGYFNPSAKNLCHQKLMSHLNFPPLPAWFNLSFLFLKNSIYLDSDWIL